MKTLYFRFLFGVCFGIVIYHLLISPTFSSSLRQKSIGNYEISQRHKDERKMSGNNVMMETNHQHERILDLHIDERHHNGNYF